MRPVKQVFYTSRQWRALRERALDVQCLCARCEAEGRTTAASTVHHRKAIDWQRIARTMKAAKRQAQSVAEAWQAVAEIEPHGVDLDNLESLCRPCHEAEHGRSAGQQKDRAARDAIRALALRAR